MVTRRNRVERWAPSARHPHLGRTARRSKMTDQRLLLISPVYNEGRHIETVVRAVAGQTRPPDRWIVADDGSTDDTLATLRRLEAEIGFLSVLERPADVELPQSPDRLSVALEARTFNRGLRQADDLSSYTHVGKLDGDIRLPPAWFATLLQRFADDRALGIAGGTLVEARNGRQRRLVIPRYHVHGAVKLYSRACFKDIGGIEERLAWDTIDETYARMAGYETRSFPELVADHLRPAASADGQLRGRARHGECAWILHYPPAWVLARSAKVATDPPVLLSGTAFLWGYARAAAQGVARVEDPRFRAFTRRELRRRVGQLL
ncbi:MAG TPA: glycosyltransferase [Solirubrobacteraceae bacterium]|nr:glycosyltransferase [Solirubrobacteraceae bacterium]